MTTVNTKQKVGATSWSDPSLQPSAGGDKSNGKDRFLRLVPGSNVIRVLTEPYQYYQHRYKLDANERGFGHRIPCSAKNGACAVCAKGDKPKRRWYLGVIDRKTQTYKILDVSLAVLSDIQTYSQDSDWGDPIGYDFDIVVNPNGGATGYYKAVAKPAKPLSANDLLLKEQVDIADLERRCTPPEPSKVDERLAALMTEFLNGSAPASNTSAPVSFAKPAPSAPKMAVGDDEGFQDSDDTTAPPF